MSVGHSDMQLSRQLVRDCRGGDWVYLRPSAQSVLEPYSVLPSRDYITTMVHHWTDIIDAIIQDLSINAIINFCFGKCRDEPPVSPTLSAQEGELDNLLAEPSGGWDDLPQSRGYNKKAAMHAESGVSQDPGRKMGSARTRSTWTEGRTMEELEREEEELAKFDPPGPPREVEEFGDFEQASTVDEASRP
jgi:hypothetical protein